MIKIEGDVVSIHGNTAELMKDFEHLVYVIAKNENVMEIFRQAAENNIELLNAAYAEKVKRS